MFYVHSENHSVFYDLCSAPLKNSNSFRVGLLEHPNCCPQQLPQVSWCVLSFCLKRGSKLSVVAQLGAPRWKVKWNAYFNSLARREPSLESLRFKYFTENDTLNTQQNGWTSLSTVEETPLISFILSYLSFAKVLFLEVKDLRCVGLQIYAVLFGDSNILWNISWNQKKKMRQTWRLASPREWQSWEGTRNDPKKKTLFGRSS